MDPPVVPGAHEWIAIQDDQVGQLAGFQGAELVVDFVGASDVACGRLQNLHINTDGESDPPKDLTYQQDGVEGYKKLTRKNAALMQQSK